jgi:hypothetical protein
MVMDWSRTAKVGKFRLYSDDLGTFVTARWYRAMPDAKLFPDWHRFGNSDWFPDDTAIAVGDYNQSPRQFDQGVPPGFVHGNAYCGPLRYFQEGVKRSENPTPLPRDPITGLAQCCKGSPEPGAWHEAERLATPFGFAVNWNDASGPASGAGTMPAWNEAEQQASGAGADSTWQEAETQASGAGMKADWQEAELQNPDLTPDGADCEWGSETPFAHYRLYKTGVGNDSCTCTSLNGFTSLTQTAECEWRSSNFPFCSIPGQVRWRLLIDTDGTAAVAFARVTSPLIMALWRSEGPWDGVSQVICVLEGVGSTHCVWPDTVTVYPVP